MNIHRYYFPGQIVFITQIVNDRKPLFYEPQNINILKGILTNVKDLHPFTMLAYVFLPDHFHILIHPTGQSNFSQILHSIKRNFTHAYKQHMNISGPLKIWQKRFWDHVIRDEKDMENHLHYIHYNPIKHGYVNDLGAWENCSYNAWQERGLYDQPFQWREPENSSWGDYI
jgi:putative transposase